MLKNLILIIGFSIYVFLLAVFSKEGFPKANNSAISFPYLSEKPVTEDGYYALTVAWNLGTGNGITYNFSQPAAGFQPLYVFIISAIAFITKLLGLGKYEFVRSVIIFSGISLLVFLYVIRNLSNSIVEQKSKEYFSLITLLLVLFNYKVFLNFLNGLETGLYLIILAVCIHYSLKIFQTAKWYGYLVFGFLLGITALARIDFILPSFLFLLVIAIKKKLGIIQIIIIALSYLIIILPWFLYVKELTGSLLPSSAIVQSRGSGFTEIGYRIDQFFFSILNPFVPFYFTGLQRTYLFYFPVIVFLWFLFKKYWKEKPVWTSNDSFQVILYWALSFAPLIIIYLIFASVPYFYFRYFSFLLVIALPLLSIILTDYFGAKKRRYAWLLVTAVLVLFSLNNFTGLFLNKSSSSLAVRAGFIKDNFSKEEKIGLFQSGIAGFFFENVVNLDGKMNFDALEYAKQNKLTDYFDSAEINILMEWQEVFTNIDSTYLSTKWIQYSKKVPDNKSIVFIRKKIEH